MAPEAVNFELIGALHGLEWAAAGEFSARITPAQAEALLADREELLAFKAVAIELTEKLAALQVRTNRLEAILYPQRDPVGVPLNGRSST